MDVSRELRDIVTESHGIYLLTNLYDANGFAIEEFLSYRTFMDYSDNPLYNLHIRQLFNKIGLMCELGKVNLCIEQWEPERVSVINGIINDLRNEIQILLKEYPK